MQSIKLAGVHVGVASLAPHVRSVVESFLYLLRSRFDSAAMDSKATVNVEFFDRLVDLQAHVQSGRKAFCVYIRGFEPFARAALADAVIERPIRPSVLEATLQRFRSTASTAAPDVELISAEALTYTPDQLLRWLYQSSSPNPVHIRCADAHWWCCPALAEVRGTPLDVAQKTCAATPVAFIMEAGPASAAQPAAQTVPYDQWVYLIARLSSGATLIDHDEHHAFSIGRSAISATDNREFARLSALFLRPYNVQMAANLARTTAAVVRQFLNANLALHRTTQAKAPISAPSSTPADIGSAASPTSARSSTPSGNLFSRLFKRLVSGNPHVR